MFSYIFQDNDTFFCFFCVFFFLIFRNMFLYLGFSVCQHMSMTNFHYTLCLSTIYYILHICTFFFEFACCVSLFIVVCLATSLSVITGFAKSMLFKNYPVFLYSIDFWPHFYDFISFCSFKCVLFLFFWPIESNFMYLQPYLFSGNYSENYYFLLGTPQEHITHFEMHCFHFILLQQFTISLLISFLTQGLYRGMIIIDLVHTGMLNMFFC